MLQYLKLVAIVFKWEFRNLPKDFEPYIEAVKKIIIIAKTFKITKIYKLSSETVLLYSMLIYFSTIYLYCNEGVVNMGRA